MTGEVAASDRSKLVTSLHATGSYSNPSQIEDKKKMYHIFLFKEIIILTEFLSKYHSNVARQILPLVLTHFIGLAAM